LEIGKNLYDEMLKTFNKSVPFVNMTTKDINKFKRKYNFEYYYFEPDGTTAVRNYTIKIDRKKRTCEFDVNINVYYNVLYDKGIEWYDTYFQGNICIIDSDVFYNAGDMFKYTSFEEYING